MLRHSPFSLHTPFHLATFSSSFFSFITQRQSSEHAKTATLFSFVINKVEEEQTQKKRAAIYRPIALPNWLEKATNYTVDMMDRCGGKLAFSGNSQLIDVNESLFVFFLLSLALLLFVFCYTSGVFFLCLVNFQRYTKQKKGARARLVPLFSPSPFPFLFLKKMLSSSL